MMDAFLPKNDNNVPLSNKSKNPNRKSFSISLCLKASSFFFFNTVPSHNHFFLSLFVDLVEKQAAMNAEFG